MTEKPGEDISLEKIIAVIIISGSILFLISTGLLYFLMGLGL